MPYIYLMSSVVLAASESIMGGFYNKKNENKKDLAPLYSFLSMCSVFLFWAVCFGLDRSFDLGVTLYSCLFAFFYTLCNVSMINALRTGPISLTSLFMQLSMIGATIWGFFFWGTQFTLLVCVGLVLVVLAICLALNTGKKEEGPKINLKWIVYVIFAFIGNAGCSIVQRTQQILYDGQYGNFLMLIATGLSVLICLWIYLKSDKSDSKEIIKGSWYIPTAGGFCNGFLNLFVILLATTALSPSLIYPTIGVGSLMVTTMVSALIFKEKLYWTQWLGLLVGAVATVILSI